MGLLSLDPEHGAGGTLMKSKRLDAFRCRHASTQSVNLAKEILLSLPEMDREVLRRLYSLGQEADEIEAALGLAPGHVEGIKRSAKARFFEERKARTNAGNKTSQGSFLASS